MTALLLEMDESMGGVGIVGGNWVFGDGMSEGFDKSDCNSLIIR